MRSPAFSLACHGLLFALLPTLIFAGGNPPSRIEPGKVIVPTDRMRRIWGELVSLDLKTRTGTFRNESNDELMPFTVLPYAELLHHATFGDLQDFRVGERAIFRLHENDRGQWVWLTYIQDEMNFLHGHKEYYWVERIDAAKGRLEVTQANADKSFVRDKGFFLDTDPQTRFWKAGQPAKFADIQVGNKLQTKTHGVGKGKVRVCWEVFLDEASLQTFQAEQKILQRQRLTAEGLPGYVDATEGGTVKLTLFQEARELAKDWKKGQTVKLAPAGLDRQAQGSGATGRLSEIQPAGNLYKVTLKMEALPVGLAVGKVARLWKTP